MVVWKSDSFFFPPKFLTLQINRVPYLFRITTTVCRRRIIMMPSCVMLLCHHRGVVVGGYGKIWQGARKAVSSPVCSHALIPTNLISLSPLGTPGCCMKHSGRVLIITIKLMCFLDGSDKLHCAGLLRAECGGHILYCRAAAIAINNESPH